MFSQKHPSRKMFSISFKEFFDLLDAAFVKQTNKMFERYNLLSRKQKDRESYKEQFLGALSDLARTCEMEVNAEQGRIGDVIKLTMRNCDLQQRLLSEKLNRVGAFNQAIIDEKG